MNQGRVDGSAGPVDCGTPRFRPAARPERTGRHRWRLIVPRVSSRRKRSYPWAADIAKVGGSGGDVTGVEFLRRERIAQMLGMA